MGLWDLFVAASIPVVKVLVVTGVGSFLALENINILGEDARKHLNKIVFFVFNPALIGSNLANTITYESMAKMWFMPFNIIITFIIGSALGYVVVKLTKTPPHLKGLVIGCCAAGNLGQMPIIIIPAVCKEKGSPFGAPDVCNASGMTYVSLSMAMGAICLWSYVYNIVRISSNTKEVFSIGGSLKSEQGSFTAPLISLEDSENHSDQFDGKSQFSLVNRMKQYTEVIVSKLHLKRVFTPSTSGAAVGFIIGLVPVLRKLFIGETAPLRVIESSAFLLGDGAIPSLTLIVGGNLLKGSRGSGIQKSIIVGIVIARYIFSPLIGIAVIKGAVWLNLVHSEPLYQFVLLLQFALPPAMNIGTITQLFGSGETECSVIMLWMYGLASISLTLWSTLFMWMVI